jgi:threo-3-hydroxy-L-aspartate ammonia-lyase
VSGEEGLDAAAVRAAAAEIAGQVVRTPALRSEAIDARAGAEIWLKAENLQRIGAFKARGALCCVGRLDPAARSRGVITYSSGNHGQAVALAARVHGVAAHVAMPEDAPAVKVEAVRALGGAITFAGHTSDDRYRAALAIQAETGGVIVPPFDHPDIIAGQGTATLELLEDAGALDALVVPVGGGGLIAGACLIAAEAGVPVYAVEPVGCDALAKSLVAGKRVAVPPGPTIADGLKPVMIGALNFAIARRHVAACVQVDDAQIAAAMAVLLRGAKLLVEPSGAAALAAVLAGAIPGRRIGAILSGGNVDPERVCELIRGIP